MATVMFNGRLDSRIHRALQIATGSTGRTQVRIIEEALTWFLMDEERSGIDGNAKDLIRPLVQEYDSKPRTKE